MQRPESEEPSHNVRKMRRQSMSKYHHQRGAESMAGGNSGRRVSVGPQLQSVAGTSRKIQVAGKQSATKPQKKAA